MDTSRRSLFRILAGVGTASAAVGIAHSAGTAAPSALPLRSLAPTNAKWVMVIDLAKCDGCRDCTKACRAMHFVPPMQEWITVYEVAANSEAGAYFLPRTCMHCDNPPCVRACPVGATYKRSDGIVMQDNNRCIGCRSCIAQCPYSAREFNWSEPPHTAAETSKPYDSSYSYPHRKGTIEKCDFCADMASAGKLPACASACSMGAVYYGDEYEDAVTNSKGETLQLSRAVKRGAGYRLLEELGTEPRVYYLPPVNRKYAAPDEKAAIAPATEGRSA